MSDERTIYTDYELLYAEKSRCHCGAGLAYPLDYQEAMRLAAWACSAFLRGEAPHGQHDLFPFAFYKIREEGSIHGSLLTTRPTGTSAFTIGTATCPQCGESWCSEPYVAAVLSHHWRPGPCPACTYTVGAGLSWSSADGQPIDVRYKTVVKETS